MRILHHLGVCHIFIVALFMCAHRPFIALCQETDASSPILSGKPKTTTQNTGSQADQAKVPSEENKKNVNVDLDTDDDKEESDDGTVSDKKTNQLQDTEGKPIVSSSGNKIAEEQDDTGKPPQDTGGTSSEDSVKEDTAITQSSHVALDVKEEDVPKIQDNVENTLGLKVPLTADDDAGKKEEDVGSVSAGDNARAQETSEKDTAGDQQNPTNNNPSSKPEINLPPEPLPVAAPATEPNKEKSQSSVETVKETTDPVGEEVKNAPNAVEGDRTKDVQDPKQDLTTGNEQVESKDSQETVEVPKQKEDDAAGLQTDSDEKATEKLVKGEEKAKLKEVDEKATKEGEEVKNEEEIKAKEGETKTGEGDQTKPNEAKESITVNGTDKATPEQGEGIETPPVKEEIKTPGEGEEKPGEPEEKMPSFDEWKEKMLQEEELKKQEQGQTTKPASPPARPKFSLTENSKNHASSDCGAKLLLTNKESQSPTAILNINPDLYMLNPCTAKIKFIVELCEPIQIKQIEIGNYELFSSVPESFRVFISDRYPAREWHQLGVFHARNERVLQSFPLPHDEQMFAKYMKFEMLTFFGSEHYCPLTVLRVFGTNVVEEIEDADAADDIGLDSTPEFLPPHPTPLPDDDKQKNGLLESARDVVIGLVQRAAKVLAGREDPDWKYDEDLPCFPEDAPSNSSRNVMSDRQKDSKELPFEEHLEICMPSIYRQCVGIDIDFSSMRRLCRGRSCCFCPNYAERFEYCRKRKKGRTTDVKKAEKLDSNAVAEGRSEDLDSNNKPIDKIDDKAPPAASVDDELKKVEIEDNKEIIPTRTSLESAATKADSLQPKEDKNIPLSKDDTLVITSAPTIKQLISSVIINITSLRAIQPTRAIQPVVADKTESAQSSRSTSSSPAVLETKAEAPKLEPTMDVNQGVPSRDDPVEKTPSLDQVGAEKDTVVVPQDKPPVSAEIRDSSDGKSGEKVQLTEKDKAAVKPVEKDKTEEEPPKAASKTENPAKSPDSATVSSGGGGGNSGMFVGAQKESVFMRLNNRIKDLELNMSLSSRYLEELSQRYRKQMEEMQKSFTQTIAKLTENAQTAHERDDEQLEYISKLETQLKNVVSQLENTTLRIDTVIREVVERHLFLMFIEIFVMSLLFLFCIGRRPSKIYIPVENGVHHSVKSPVQNHIGHAVIPAAVAPPRGWSSGHSSEGEGRPMHASPRRRNRSFDECTPAKASATNKGGGSCDDLLIIGHTTPFLEALQQSNSPNGANKRKGKHKSRLKASKSSSGTSIALTNGDHPEGHHTNENQAGLLFKGSVSKNETSNGSSSIFTNGAIKKLFSSNSIDRIEELSNGGAPPGTATVEVLPQSTFIGPKQQKPNKLKHQKHSRRDSAPLTFKPTSVSASSLAASSGQQKLHGKGSDKKTKSSPSLQQLNVHQSGPGRPPHQSGSAGTKKQTKKTSPMMMNGKR